MVAARRCQGRYEARYLPPLWGGLIGCQIRSSLSEPRMWKVGWAGPAVRVAVGARSAGRGRTRHAVVGPIRRERRMVRRARLQGRPRGRPLLLGSSMPGHCRAGAAMRYRPKRRGAPPLTEFEGAVAMTAPERERAMARIERVQGQDPASLLGGLLPVWRQAAGAGLGFLPSRFGRLCRRPAGARSLGSAEESGNKPEVLAGLGVVPGARTSDLFCMCPV